MADPIDFPEATHTLGRPANMTDAQCGGLRVAIGEREGFPVRVSCWKLSMTELENVIKTGNVFLLVWGDFHPPVSITGERPFD